MKLAILTVLATVLIGGCTAFNRVTDLGTSPEVIRITPEVVEEQHTEGIIEGARNVLEAIRQACMQDGHFNLNYYGKQESYLCFPVNPRGSVVDVL